MENKNSRKVSVNAVENIVRLDEVAKGYKMHLKTILIKLMNC